MSRNREITVSEILNVVGTDMFQINRHHPDFPFMDDVESVMDNLHEEFPDFLTSTDSHQKLVSEELRDEYLDLLKRVQEWEKETGHESIIQLHDVE